MIFFIASILIITICIVISTIVDIKMYLDNKDDLRNDLY